MGVQGQGSSGPVIRRIFVLGVLGGLDLTVDRRGQMEEGKCCDGGGAWGLRSRAESPSQWEE